MKAFGMDEFRIVTTPIIPVSVLLGIGFKPFCIETSKGPMTDIIYESKDISDVFHIKRIRFRLLNAVDDSQWNASFENFKNGEVNDELRRIVLRSETMLNKKLKDGVVYYR